MKKITRAILAATALERYIKQYPEPFTFRDGSNSSDIIAGLRELGEQPNPDDVDRVVGNRSWTEVPLCDECGKTDYVVIEIGEPLDYESATARVCWTCLLVACALACGTKP